ncbi:glyoxalase superfamily protein [Streptomyces sp. NPDC050504]|uniref:glyoxalase superfamily protein n=1 Tax=Streptomyces sp. NPDC050504 TaxID=3365618 RepID=UPI0037A5A364
MSEQPSRPEEAIPVLRVLDAAASVAWYARLGFRQLWEHRFEPGFPAFVEIARGPMRLFLSEHEGDARPNTLVYLRVPDVDALVADFGVTGEDTEYGMRETELTDPDGNRIRVGTELPER